jgi:hypothetical protein
LAGDSHVVMVLRSCTMSIKAKFFLATYVFPIGSFIACAALNGRAVGLVLFFGSFGWYYYIKNCTRCPNCGRHVWTHVVWWSSPHWEFGIPVDCEHCGFPF